MRKIILVISFLVPFCVFSQNKSKIDSLTLLFDNSKNDTSKINYLHQLVYETDGRSPHKALDYAIQEVKYSENIKFKLDRSYNDLAWQYKIATEYKKSLETFFKAEKYVQIFKSPEKEKAIADINAGLASVYSALNNQELAISKVKNALKIRIQLNDTLEIAISKLNLGSYYYIKGDLTNALTNYNDALTLFIIHKDTSYLPDCYNNIGGLLYQLGKHKEALLNFEKSLILILKTDSSNISSIAIAYTNIGQCYNALNNMSKGLEYCLKAADLFEKLDDLNNLNNTYFNIAIMYQKLGDLNNSNLYYLNYAVLKDSIYNRESRNAIHDISIKYETDKKEKENQFLSLENKNKNLIIYFAFGGCALLFGLVFFIFKGYRVKQKANNELENKNTIINRQKEVVEEQHLEITDSIKYAQRIQGAILPPRNLWQKMLPNSFVLYMPKDVLSGDFYWIEETKDYIYVAAADCTGHGVPGALISIVNYNLLNKAVLEQNLVTPSEILDAVNMWLTESLHQTYRESAVRDGMDVSLIAIHKHSNEVLYAGANNPIYVVSKGESKQIKGYKFPVGAFIEDQIQKFTTKSFKVNQGDIIYLFSDGFADQFGGDNGKKYKYAPFQQKLISIADMDLSQQRLIMKEEFFKWKGTHEQVDDVLLIGIKIS